MEDQDLAAGSSDSMNQEPSGKISDAPILEYMQLQRRIFRSTLIVSALAVAFTAYFLGFEIASSTFIGSLAGMLYLRLLARSVGKIGNGTRNVGKIQLLVPVLLVLAASRFSQLELLPALLGFLLYKPSLVFQFLLESRGSIKT